MADELPPLTQACAGAIGSAASNLIAYPLDLVTTRTQTAPTRRADKGKARAGQAAHRRGDDYSTLVGAVRTIYAKEGATSFYRGVTSDTVSTCMSNFLFYLAHSFLRTRLLLRKEARVGSSKTGVKLSAPEEIAIGMVAGIVSRFFTNPISNITVRKQTSASAAQAQDNSTSGANVPGTEIAQSKSAKEDDSSSDDEDGDYSPGPSAMTILREIYDDKGITGFWSGFKSACFLTTSPALTLYLLELFKRIIIPQRDIDAPRAWQTLLASAMASSLANTAVYPMILAKTRLQWKSPSGKHVYRSITDVFAKTLKRQGPAGLYTGLSAQLAKGLFSLPITMLVKQRVELLIVEAYRRAQRRRTLI
ncbi:uncharacterized protein L969DRAFT_89327 [Mixia osmundae IAM 14324]|uniref:Mitochondrial carrier n=1 Tax=Mixia osmundae (strain CBS 9802 / IAM 14324 / JCM 22182 / KY 12970) TaxID=764103 RepID=G7DX24_MIXOS|nr:uncharacterized protein L969DRAFT_89327 [Mixia osmundae IAM 14324]KEI38070.1 hypothetical protein L969DRAFT_89327 [Mixia osmundae IAM 14324]GAA95121.1 hypothetical protein E5Q_01776 [Mixia osmundae IAM 14324]